MSASQMTSQKKSFSEPDEVVNLPKLRVEIIKFGEMPLERATWEPGWKWSEQMKPIAGTETCQGTHFTYIISGRMRTRMEDGTEFDLGPGDVAIHGPGHDVWVLGDEPCVGFDFQGASKIG